MNCSEVRVHLNPWLDGELTPAQAEPIAAHVAGCAACAARRDAAREISASLLASPYTAAPDALRDRIIAAAAARPPRMRLPRRVALAAAAVALLAIGGSAGAFVASRRQADPVSDEIVSSHIRSLLVADHLIDVLSSDRHTVKPWFAGKLSFAPPVEDLANAGFPLIGGRVDYVADRAVAAIVYGRRNHRINVFMWPAETDQPARQRTVRGFHVLHWAAHGMNFWVVSDAGPDELQELARHF